MVDQEAAALKHKSIYKEIQVGDPAFCLLKTVIIEMSKMVPMSLFYYTSHRSMHMHRHLCDHGNC